jgi:YhcH/YjgK/YiaL family protein
MLLLSDALIDAQSPQYQNLTPALKAALNWVRVNQKTFPALGKHELPDGAFAIAQKYLTQKPGQFENHHKYIDLQVLLQGKEYIYWNSFIPEEIVTPTTPYVEQNDIEFQNPLRSMTEYNRIFLQRGIYCFLFPGDWHMPCIQCEPDGTTTSEVFKIVVKIPITAPK